MKYSEYLAQCEASETEPLPLKEWRTARLREAAGERKEARAAQKLREEHDASLPAETAAPKPPPAAEPGNGLPENPVFFSPHRFYVEVMQAGQKMVLNNQLAVLPHITIEFTEHHWIPDMTNPQDVQKAEYLMGSRAMRDGKVSLIPDYHHISPIGVQDGPRTAATSRQRVARPAGELSAKL